MVVTSSSKQRSARMQEFCVPTVKEARINTVNGEEKKAVKKLDRCQYRYPEVVHLASITRKHETIEFQKRGLPHVHVLLKLVDSPTEASQNNALVTAEIPAVSAPAVSAPALPELPNDLLRMIWQAKWREDAACHLQRVARGAITRWQLRHIYCDMPTMRYDPRRVYVRW